MIDKKGEIHIENLRVPTRIGVPDQERASAQEVAVCLTMVPERAMAGLGDAIGKTIDYYEVGLRVAAIAGDGERKLIETLAEDIADTLLREFALDSLAVEVRKFILENADYVSVKLQRRLR
jgi:dihydroneopterin aldolase